MGKINSIEFLYRICTINLVHYIDFWWSKILDLIIYTIKLQIFNWNILYTLFNDVSYLLVF